MLFNPIVGLLPWLGVDPRPPIIENPDLALGAVALNALFDTVFYRLGIWGIPLATSTVNVVASAVLLVMMRRRVGLEHLGRTAAVVVRVFPPAEHDVDLHLVLLLEEGPGPLDLEVDVVLACLGAEPNLLQLYLVLLGVLRQPALLF